MFVMPHYRAVVFDLDGTLLDTVQDIADAVNLSLEAYGRHPLPLQQYRKLVGAGLEELLISILGNHARDETFFEAFRQAVVDRYNQRLTHKTQPYPGISELLASLCNSRIPRAVLSNKAHDKTTLVVDHFFSSHWLNPVLGAREGQPLKPDPSGALEIAQGFGIEPGDILYVGDTPSDMETARRSGMLPLGVAWGFRPVKELKEGGAKGVLLHPRHLWDFLTR